MNSRSIYTLQVRLATPLATPTTTEPNQRTIGADLSLAAHGAIMLLLGLLSGFTPFFARAKVAGLEAHNIGVMQGTLLFALAAVWPSLGRGGLVTAARCCGIIGLYANWLGALLSAFWSARGMFIVNGASMPEGAAPWMETTVAILLNVSILVIVMSLLILWAILKRRES
jgi:hypothetical protein